jgi:hypothetical protein
MLAASPARAAAGLGIPELDVGSLISQSVVDSLVVLAGFGFQHRPYEPATPLLLSSPVGFDLSFEATLVKVPDGFFESLAEIGMPMAANELPSLPSLKFHAHKGFAETLDIGGSAIWYLNNKVLGADAKVLVLQAEEGPSIAMRLCYTYATLGSNNVTVTTHTFSPQILLSRPIEFADPYLGIAYEYTYGRVTADMTAEAKAQAEAAGIPAELVPDIGTLEKFSRAMGGMAFGGISLRVPRSGLRTTLEMSYNTAGVSSMGMKLGFSF